MCNLLSYAQNTDSLENRCFLYTEKSKKEEKTSK